MDFIGVIKEHPIPVAAGVVILLVVLKSSSNNTAKAQATSGYNPAIDLQFQALAADTNVKINGQNTSANIMGMQLDTAMANARTKYSADMFTTATAAEVELNKISSQSFTTGLTNFFSRLDNQQQFGNQLALGSKSIDSNQILTVAGFDNQYRMLQADTGRQLSLAGINSDTQKYGIDSGRQIAMAQIGVNSSLGNKALDYKFSIDNKTIDSNNVNLPSLLQHSENSAKIAGSNAQALSVINGQTAQAIAAMNASVAMAGISAGKSANDQAQGQSLLDKLLKSFSGGGGGSGGGSSGGGKTTPKNNGGTNNGGWGGEDYNVPWSDYTHEETTNPDMTFPEYQIPDLGLNDLGDWNFAGE
jgi:hypothetical protein